MKILALFLMLCAIWQMSAANVINKKGLGPNGLGPGTKKGLGTVGLGRGPIGKGLGIKPLGIKKEPVLIKEGIKGHGKRGIGRGDELGRGNAKYIGYAR